MDSGTSMRDRGALEDYMQRPIQFHVILLLIFGLTVGSCESPLAESTDAEAASTTTFSGTEIQIALTPVCNFGGSNDGGAIWVEGTPIESAAAYQGNGIHPFVIVSSSEEISSWNEQINEEWFPDSVEDAQLVVCVGPMKKEVVEVCEYMFGGDVTRYQYGIPVRLIEARTGQTVIYQTVYAKPPRDCQASESLDLVELVGPEVTYSWLSAWLQNYVEGEPVINQSATGQPNLSEPNILSPVDNFEPGTFERSTSDDTRIGCELDTARFVEGTASLRISWKLGPQDWGYCMRALEPQDWNAAQGVTFWYRADRAGAEVTLWLDTASTTSIYAGYFITTEESIDYWVPVSIRWDELSPAPWAPGPFEPFDLSTIQGYGFALGTHGSGGSLQLWVDDIALFAEN